MKFKGFKKTKILLVCLILIATVAVGTTTAFLIDESGILTNTFNPNDVNTEVEETLSGNVKSNVKIKNVGTTDAFIRAYISVSWQDAQGNVFGTAPVLGTDYTMSTDTTGAWVKAADGFYYHVKSVAAEMSTSVLINSCSPVAGRAPDGYELTVEILGSGIQNKPVRVVKDKWQSGVSDATTDTLTVKR